MPASQTPARFLPWRSTMEHMRPLAEVKVASPTMNGSRVSPEEASASKPVCWSAPSRSAGCTCVPKRLARRRRTARERPSS
eukprot:scaffold36275_cov154-Isochrysis_galbana.AAC.30